MPGPIVRTDIVEIYVFRRPLGDSSLLGIEFLQMRRAKGQLKGSWAPVMGHVEGSESATFAALRELKEETGFGVGQGILHFWQLESLNTYFLANIDTIVMGPGFVAEVEPGAEPVMDDSHDAMRWVRRDHADRFFLWPGQRAAIDQITRDILPPDSPSSEILRIKLHQ